MKKPESAIVRALAIVVLAFLVAGCATNKPDWASRVGSYTYDEAVLDLGPPDKQARLSDGTLVAEWLTRRGSNHLYSTRAYYPYWAGPVYPTYIDSHTPDYFLRLTFDSEGKLRAWKKHMR